MSREKITEEKCVEKRRLRIDRKGQVAKRAPRGDQESTHGFHYTCYSSLNPGFEDREDNQKSSVLRTQSG